MKIVSVNIVWSKFNGLFHVLDSFGVCLRHEFQLRNNKIKLMFSSKLFFVLKNYCNLQNIFCAKQIYLKFYSKLIKDFCK